MQGDISPEVSNAARAMGKVKTEKKTASSRRTLAQARETLQADPEAKERQRAAVSAAQTARWEKYREAKATESSEKS
jgi:hypothetical protein